MSVLPFKPIGAWPHDDSPPPPPDIEPIECNLPFPAGHIGEIPTHTSVAGWVIFCLIFVVLASLGVRDVVEWTLNAWWGA